MLRVMVLYGVALAFGALLLEWLDYKHMVRAWSTEVYIGIVAILFITLGIWVGNRLTPQRRSPAFERNNAAIRSLGISERECEVLDLLASGAANKVIARRLGISPNTVKTHVARLFEKLEAANRTEAIHKARTLDILP
jgi:DNA-binding CsgD family transcriptional regulator